MSRPSRFAPYKAALEALSTRTGTPIPSLALSFAVLHEATAILPVIGLFYACRALGAGDAAVRYIHSQRISQTEGFNSSILSRANMYLEEGEARAARFGKRYGLWGLNSDENKAETGLNLAGDIANAAVAYGITKALFPLRIAASMYLAPGFSRAIFDPTRRSIVSLGQRLCKR